MKIKYGKLKKLIREAQTEILQEEDYARYDNTPSYLVDFAKAYARLGPREREQFDQVTSHWYTGIPGEQKARQMISNRQKFDGLRAVLDALSGPLDELDGEDAKDLQELLGAIRDEHSGGGGHPMDTDGDGNVDWDEIQ